MSGPRWPPADLPHAQARAASFLPVREMRDAGLAAAADQAEPPPPVDAARHGLYNYFLMRGLMRDADADGDRVLTLGELAAFVQRNTRREAARLGRDQSPVLVGNGGKAVMRW
jgi:hypothetical protein